MQERDDKIKKAKAAKKAAKKGASSRLDAMGASTSRDPMVGRGSCQSYHEEGQHGEKPKKVPKTARETWIHEVRQTTPAFKDALAKGGGKARVKASELTALQKLYFESEAYKKIKRGLNQDEGYPTRDEVAGKKRLANGRSVYAGAELPYVNGYKTLTHAIRLGKVTKASDPSEAPAEVFDKKARCARRSSVRPSHWFS